MLHNCSAGTFAVYEFVLAATEYNTQNSQLFSNNRKKLRILTYVTEQQVILHG